MGLFSWIRNKTSTFPGDTDGDGNLNADETAALLKAPEDNSLKKLIRAQNFDSNVWVNEMTVCAVKGAITNPWKPNELTDTVNTVGDAFYKQNLNQYLQNIKTGDGFERNVAALTLNGISSSDDFAGLEQIELPRDFCAIRKNNPDKQK